MSIRKNVEIPYAIRAGRTIIIITNQSLRLRRATYVYERLRYVASVFFGDRKGRERFYGKRTSRLTSEVPRRIGGIVGERRSQTLSRRRPFCRAVSVVPSLGSSVCRPERVGRRRRGTVTYAVVRLEVWLPSRTIEYNTDRGAVRNDDLRFRGLLLGFLAYGLRENDSHHIPS